METLARLSAAVLAAAVAACGGASPPAESAEPASTSPEEESPDVDEPAAPPASEGSGEAPAAETVSVQSFQNALQAVIGDPALLEAMGIDPSSNKPLLISGKDLPAGLERAAAVRSVEIVPLSEKPSKKPVLLFTRVELDSKRGTFKYKCEATGVYGSTRVAYEGGSWQLKSSQISHL